VSDKQPFELDELDDFNALLTGKKWFAKMLRNENSKLFSVLV
tara:strand:- start:137 stop:262 length:126 start_codon:yes stop_codon:yes gene_type:complete